MMRTKPSFSNSACHFLPALSYDLKSYSYLYIFGENLPSSHLPASAQFLAFGKLLTEKMTKILRCLQTPHDFSIIHGIHRVYDGHCRHGRHQQCQGQDGTRAPCSIGWPRRSHANVDMHFVTPQCVNISRNPMKLG